MPVDRGERYEDPLSEVLEKEGVAEVTGGGTMQASNGEIEYCGIDLVLHDVDRAVPIVCEVLSELGAPKGSALEYSIGKKRVSVPFGILEGLAIYLNGTDLPKEVYETSDINAIYADIERLLGERGDIQGHWQGPTETALYLYGYSVTEMKKLLAAYMAKTPLCARARLVKIA
ncbi:MAG: hypothetical protein JST00_30565 [Deltaproteobacteria bacterium]|nr:hypothetical protein [Deltaproteobacteria bacterium]